MTYRLCVASAVVCLLAACAGSGTTSLAVCAGPGEESPEYLIGTGDELDVFVWRNPELSTGIPVRPDGRLSMPLVEDMVAVGKTPTQLARDIEAVLGQFIREPQVNIIVRISGGANQVQVLGSVVAPQSLPYRQGIRVLDLVVSAGGLMDFAAGNRAKIVRTSGDNAVECPVRLDDLIKDGDVSQNVELRPGDVIIVPESNF